MTLRIRTNTGELTAVLRMHDLEVVTPDGKHHPHFVPATPEQARAHKEPK